MNLSPSGVRIFSNIGKDGTVEGHPAAVQHLAGAKLARHTPSGTWRVTKAGHQAIAAHREAPGSGARA
ncbi:hypothetical protein KNE206_30070 [Kitasatospora sp. NE20-6]|uniref:hypothetical protein n=1 Tax=Kitasatospora sp. NE20-6 TaxID=2859066 RepID=UPI0034DC14AF